MLRHKIMLGGMNAVERATEKREVLPRFKPYSRVEFKRGGDTGVLLDALKKNRCVEVAAAVGAGKSTVCPMLLSRVTGKLVVHTIPFWIASRRMAEYMGTTVDGDRVVYVDDLESDLPKHGVVLTTNAYIHARIAADSLAGVENAILYLDESHESDAATAVLRTVAPSIRAFSNVVKATATADPGQSMTVDLPGKRRVKKFSPRDVKTWDANDTGVPWSVNSIRGNTMIMMDRPETRNRLAAQYKEHGFDVRICLADGTYEYYRATEDKLRDPSGSIVVLFVDYAYRSSLTIPSLTDAIESGEVGVPSVVDGCPVMRYRAAYDFEIQQFFGRGNRLPGESVTLWCPDVTPPMKMCDVEELECDAANLLYRLMGFRPPLELMDYDYYKGDVPVDISGALRSDHPLRLCPTESRVPWVNGQAAPAAVQRERPAYVYNFGVNPSIDRKRKTMPEPTRVPTPPPSVMPKYAVSKYDVDQLEAYAASRPQSPEPGTVFTLESEVPDNLSIFNEDSEHFAFARPMRVSKRVQEERKRAAEARVESGVFVSTETNGHIVPGAAVVAQTTESKEQQALAVCSTVNAMAPIPDKVKELRAVAEQKSEIPDLPAFQEASYFYYYRMDTAPERSEYFINGLQSIMNFCDSADSRFHAKALPETEKYYAMRLLVDATNDSTAVALGIQRFFVELSNRDPSDWMHLVEYDKVQKVLDWMCNERTNAEMRIRTYRNAMPFFMQYEVSTIAAPAQLEQRVMLQMMERFEHVAVKKDPDKMQEYLRKLNDRVVNVGSRAVRRQVH